MGVLVKFRNRREAAKGDMKNMCNSVWLKLKDCFMQCFLWRKIDESQEPDVYRVLVNNIGIKPAGAIATLALQKSVDVYQEVYPIFSY